jgi:AcrR family transcriptional regulator
VSRNPSTDPRAIRTRQQVVNAVLSLAAHRDLNGIAVEAITDCAGINRATFYRHFRDREAAVKAAMDMLFAELTAEDRVFVQAHPHLSPNVVPEGMVSQLLHIIGTCWGKQGLLRLPHGSAIIRNSSS